jgi:uncharacterized protein YkwD
MLLLTAGAIPTGAAAADGLFMPHAALEPDPASVNPAIVARQRLVDIRLDLLPMAEGQSVTLNLFDDLVVQATCVDLETDVPEGFVWTGLLPDVPGGSATINVARDTVAGYVEIPPRTYLIRWYPDEAHVIREILPPAFYSALSSDGSASPDEQEVLRLVNLERQSQNLNPLAWDNSLGVAAWGHSNDMAQQNYFSHTSLDGRLFSQRIAAAGYPCGSCGENIAAGYSTPQAVMNGWMNSSGHRANILSSSYCDLGVGYAYSSTSTYKSYWTQDFGRRPGVSACSTGGNTNPDTDGDGMPDSWETANGLNPLVNDAAQDKDGDGATNLQEYRAGTNPSVANSSPTPPATDTDGDGMPDSWETANGLNPLVNDAAQDKDGDGMTNLQEYQAGTNPSVANSSPTPPPTTTPGTGESPPGSTPSSRGGGGGGCFIATALGL